MKPRLLVVILALAAPVVLAAASPAGATLPTPPECGIDIENICPEPPPPPPPEPPPPPPPPPEEDDWAVNVGWYADYGDPYTPYFYFGGCRSPVVRREYRGSLGHHHWTYYQRVNFCWRNGRITSFSRDRWIWMSGSLLNGWRFQGHIGSNCATEDCGGRGVGWTTTSAWTQGRFMFCSLKWAVCTEQTPLIGIRVYGDGRVSYFRDYPQ